MGKIQMATPLVEMDGDEMTRILWRWIKEELLSPFLDLNTEYYDLGLKYRDETKDEVTLAAAEAIKKYKVGVKCATITPNAARVEEYHLKEMYKSPNATIRSCLDGTVFRTPILVKGIEPCVKNWKKPITIARHAYGDVYKNAEMKIPGAGKVELVYTNERGEETRELVQVFQEPGIVQGMHNLTSSIEGLPDPVFLMHWIVMKIYGFLLRIPFLKNMIILLKIFFRKFMKQNIKKNLKKKIFLIFTP